MPDEKGRPVTAFIEDQPDIVELVELILTRNNFAVVKAYDGDEGLELIRRVKPDVVLLDLMMPGLDGWKLHAALREDPDLCHIPVIYVTARASAEERLRALEEEGAAAYIIKPFSPRDLVKTIKDVLARARTENSEGDEGDCGKASSQPKKDSQ